jgi:hypothetical protein
VLNCWIWKSLQKKYIFSLSCCLHWLWQQHASQIFTSLVFWNKHPNMSIAHSQSYMLPMVLFSYLIYFLSVWKCVQ